MNAIIHAPRLLAAVTVLIAVTGVLLLIGDAVIRDQAMIFAALAALASAGALSVAFLPAPAIDAHDAWESVAWGKFFVALVYASVAVVCIIAMVHTPDGARLLHALRAAL